MTHDARQPAVTAVVNLDGTAEVRIDGSSYRIAAATPADAGSQVLGYIAATVAGPAGRPVAVHAVDCGRPEDFLVGPDGSVLGLGDEPAGRHGSGDEGWAPPNGDASGAVDGRASNGTVTAPPAGPRPGPQYPATGPVAVTSRGVAAAPGAAASSGVAAAPDYRAPGQAWPSHPAPVTAPPASHPVPAAPPSGPVAPPTSAPMAVPGPPPHAGPQLSAARPPTLEDLLASRPAPKQGPAEVGWRAAVRKLSGGLVKPGPGPAELAHRKAVQAVQRSLDGPKTIVVINTKGGGGKTTATYCLAATFGTYRGGYVLAWDDNETRGTLAWRAAQSRHGNTAVTLLRDLDRFEDARSARVGDLDNYVRGQGDAQFDVLASDEDAASAASIDAAAFHSLHRSLSRFYRIMIVDTGNNIKASNWQAAVEAADQVVIVSSIREDTAGGASWTLDSLMESGHADKVAGAVTVLSAPSKVADTALAARFEDHFRRRTRAVLRVPYDPALVDGGPIGIDKLSPATREAWLQVAATIADNL